MKRCAFSTLTFHIPVRGVISILLSHSVICCLASMAWLGVSAVHPERVSQMALSYLGVRWRDWQSWKSKSKMIAWGCRVNRSPRWLFFMAKQKQIINSLYKDHNLHLWKPQHWKKLLSVKMKDKQRNTVSARVRCMECLVGVGFLADCCEWP